MIVSRLTLEYGRRYIKASVRREFRRFDGDEIVGTFKRRSWTKLEFAKNRPKSSSLFFDSRFPFLNVMCPRFLVQMSEWCNRSQCSLFCFLFYLTGVTSQGSLCAIRTRPIGSTTFLVCFALSIIVLAVSCTFDFYRVLYYCTSIIWVIPNKAVEKKK